MRWDVSVQTRNHPQPSCRTASQISSAEWYFPSQEPVQSASKCERSRVWFPARRTWSRYSCGAPNQTGSRCRVWCCPCSRRWNVQGRSALDLGNSLDLGVYQKPATKLHRPPVNVEVSHRAWLVLWCRVSYKFCLQLGWWAISLESLQHHQIIFTLIFLAFKHFYHHANLKRPYPCTSS